MRSAGLLPYRIDGILEVMIAHPGGPYFARRDKGAWSVIKGQVEPGEDERTAAAREFEEETGWVVPAKPWVPLGQTTMRSRKVVVAWAIRHDFDLDEFRPGTFVLHGREYPEVDRVVWTGPDEARRLLNPALNVFLDRLEEHVRFNGGRDD